MMETSKVALASGGKIIRESLGGVDEILRPHAFVNKLKSEASGLMLTALFLLLAANWTTMSVFQRSQGVRSGYST
jgi:hypothetical protein